MRNLIRNEIFKVFHGKRLYIFLGILLVMFLIPVVEKFTGALLDFPLNGQSLSINMLTYLATNMLPGFIIVMMAGMVTDEYVCGTLKLSLLHPVSRTKLLTAKLCALAVAVLVFLSFTLITGYVVGTIFFGWGDSFIFKDMVYSTRDGILFTAGAYLISLLPSLVFGSVVMLVTLQFTSSGAAVGVLIASVIAMSIAGEIVQAIQPFLILYQLAFFKTALMGKGLDQFIRGLAVIIAYGLGSYLTSVYLFNKKDLFY